MITKEMRIASETIGLNLVHVKPLEEILIEENYHPVEEEMDEKISQKGLNFEVFERKDKIMITMPSRNKKIYIRPSLLDKLENEQIYYKLS